ncbi:hypothetical protein ACFFRR_001752 [Megaselia abdita]
MGGQASSEERVVEPSYEDPTTQHYFVPECRRVNTKEDQLSNVLSFISINDNKKDYMWYFTTLRNKILDKLMEISPAFKSLSNGNDLAGSYADGLKVVSPNEFDFHVYLRLREFSLLDVQRSEGFPGQVDINVKRVLNKIRNMYQYDAVYKVLSKLIDDNNILSPKKLQSWLEGLMVRALNEIGSSFTMDGNKFYLQYGKSGPAHTLYVTVNQRDSFSIDFVPVIKIMVNEHWPSERDPVTLEVNNFWVAVAKPKPCTNSFQTSFEFMERKLIKSKYNLKAVDRLLKKMRDRHGLTNLKSYYIKTVCLWKDDEVSMQFWSKSLYYVFTEVFKKLLTFCENQEMPFFWDEDQNMFDKLSNAQKRDIYLKLHKIYQEFERSAPRDIANIFLTRNELMAFNDTVPE